jgi:hypothetical protein
VQASNLPKGKKRKAISNRREVAFAKRSQSQLQRKKN